MELSELNSGVSALIVSLKYNLIISGGKDGSLAFINADSFRVRNVQKFNSLVKTLSLSVDGELVCVGCVDGSIRLFTVVDGQLVTTLANEHPRPSGKFEIQVLACSMTCFSLQKSCIWSHVNWLLW